MTSFISNGAKDTDLICVTGDLGAAYMGLAACSNARREVYYQQVDEARKKNDKRALESLKDFQPDFAGKDISLQRQLQAEARGDIIARFRDEHPSYCYDGYQLTACQAN